MHLYSSSSLFVLALGALVVRNLGLLALVVDSHRLLVVNDLHGVALPAPAPDHFQRLDLALDLDHRYRRRRALLLTIVQVRHVLLQEPTQLLLGSLSVVDVCISANSLLSESSPLQASFSSLTCANPTLLLSLGSSSVFNNLSTDFLRLVCAYKKEFYF